MALVSLFPPPGPPRADASGLLDDVTMPEGLVWDSRRRDGMKRGFSKLSRSPLTRRIIVFNLIALNVLIAAMLLLGSPREPLSVERADGLQREVALIARTIELRLDANRRTGGVSVADALEGLDLRAGQSLMIFDAAHRLVAETAGPEAMASATRSLNTGPQAGLAGIADELFGAGGAAPEERPATRVENVARRLAADALVRPRVHLDLDASGHRHFTALAPLQGQERTAGAVALVAGAAGIDAAVHAEGLRMLLLFLVATLVSIGLSLALASTIASPISVLADAAEIGRDGHRQGAEPGRISIPDMTRRADEIGRLSGALRGMVSALFDRIDGNEQFAADVAHEIKNPLASLRSAVGSLRQVRTEDHRTRLLDVIEHDVRRLDRLVSDIANASQLDSDLVKEDKEPFDLLNLVRTLGSHMSEEADRKGIDIIIDLPSDTIRVHGLEARLAQVFVNLVGNAISFCEDGDAIRIWARRREHRVLVVVEDTGPGIPDEALGKIFDRFYSQRPEADFGNNSGLGLAISKQIVEAHGGVIWAENIRPTAADITSEPLGARFVVGLVI